MFQEFRAKNRTHAYLITVLFPIWFYIYALFFKINFFSKALLDARFSCQFDFKNSIIAIKLYLVLF